MARQPLNYGTVANDGTGDSLRDAMIICNDNFIELYTDKLEWTSVPSTSSSTGVAGQISYDGTYFYLCSATDTWLRVAIATW
jgi:hypothetical protein